MNSSQTLATQSHSFSNFQSPSSIPLHYSLDSSKASNLPKSHHHANSPLQPLQLNTASHQPTTPTNGAQKPQNLSPVSLSHSKPALYASPSAKAIRFPSQNSPSIQKQVTYSPQPPKSIKKILEEKETATRLQEKGSDVGFSTPKKSLFDDSYVHRHVDETDKKVAQNTADRTLEIENQDPEGSKRNSPLQNQHTPENENLPHSDSRNAINSEIYEENEDTNNQSTRETVSDKAQDIFLSPRSNTNRPSSLHPNINALVPEIQNENIENREEIFPASNFSNLAPLSLEEGTEGFEIQKNQILAHISSQADGLQIKAQLSEQSQLSVGAFKPKKVRQCLNVLCFTDPKDPNLWSKQKVMNSAICKTCFDAYKKNQYCFFCYQIFVDQETSASNDGKDWIECDGCNRWNHIECESIHGLKEIRSLLQGHETSYKYYCPLCRNDKAAKAASKRLKSFMMAPIPVLNKAASGHKSVVAKKSVRINKSHGPAHAESTFEEEIETDQIIEEPFGKKIKPNPAANLPLSIIENFLGKIKEKEEIGTTTTTTTSIQTLNLATQSPIAPAVNTISPAVNTISPLELAKKRLDAMFIKNQANRKRLPIKLEPIPLPMDHYNDIDKLMTIYSGKRVQLSDQEIKADLDLFKELSKTSGCNSDDKSNESEDGMQGLIENTPDDSRRKPSRPRTKDVQYNENIMGGDYDDNKDEGMEYEGKRQLRNRKRPE